MTELNESSSTKKLKTTEIGNQLVEKLKERKIDAEKLVVVMIGTDQVIGEVVDPPNQYSMEDGPQVVGKSMVLKNPRRLARFQQVTRGENGQQNVAIQFMVGEYDLMEGGKMEVIPTAGFRLGWLDEQSIENYCGLYMEFLVRREEHIKRRERLKSGIVTPDEVIPPPRVR